MENPQLLPLAAAALIIMVALAPGIAGQSNSNTNTNASLCTGPMLRSFGSCLGYLTGGSRGSSPTSACCSSLRDLMSNGQDCLCLIVTGGVPLEIPINQNLAIALPKACKQSGVPIECKAPPATPVPDPDPENPGSDAPSIYPGLSPPAPLIPQVPFNPQPFTPPSSGGTTRPRSPASDLVPTLTPPGMRPTLVSAAAGAPQSLLQSLLMALMAVFLLKL